MSTINLPKVRACSDITFRVSLKDNDVAIDWTSLTNVKALIYSDVQKAVAGRCDIAVDEDDHTVLVCTYSATKPQYLGINSIVIRCKYQGREKTYDKPCVDIVARTAQATGQTQISDPEVDVDIDVEEVSTSLLDDAIAAAFDAADEATAAAHLVPLQVLEDCVQATADANEAAATANAAGIDEVTATVDANVGTPAVSVDLTDKHLTLGFTNMKGETGDAAGFGTVTASVDANVGTPAVSVSASGPDTAKSFTFAFSNLKGEKGDKGDQGNSGYTGAAGELQVVNNLTDGGSTAALSAEMGKTLEGEVSQLEHEVDSLPRGKNYGFFTSSSLLPSDATEEGFAYVGATEPYAIWQFDGTSWTDSGVTANAFTANDEQVKDAVDDYLDEHPTITGTFTNSAKRALISLLEKVAYIDGNGQQYIDQLTSALNDVAIDYIDVVFSQPVGDAGKVYDLDSLDKLRDWLVVTAYYVDGTHGEIFDYELSGTLTYGTSTITVSAGGATDTFTVTVTGTKKLYYDGDECSAVTGGWNTTGFNLTAGNPSKTKEAFDLLIMFGTSNNVGAAGSFSTANKIDLTGYAKIIIDAEFYNAAGRANFWGYWPSTLTESTTQAGAYGNDYSSNRVLAYVLGDEGDQTTYPFPNPAVSVRCGGALGTSRAEAYLSLNLNGYTVVHAYSAGAYAKIKRVFLATD